MFPGFGFPGFPQTAGPKRSLFCWEADFELPVKACREEIMSLGVTQDVSVDVMMAALADVAADTAARLDLAGDGFTLEERLQSFCRRVEQTYQRRRLELSKQPAKVVESAGQGRASG